MTELALKHQVKLQVALLLSIFSFIIYWTFTGANYIYTVENNSKRIDKIENKLEQLATKSDLAILKQDIKDFLR